jgi:hypothetical protein
MIKYHQIKKEKRNTFALHLSWKSMKTPMMHILKKAFLIQNDDLEDAPQSQSAASGASPKKNNRPENFNCLFRYLEAEQIYINKADFRFQIQSHPQYPHLISIADTLSFFSINNSVQSIEAGQIEQLPDHFSALLEMENSQPQLYFVKRKGDAYICDGEKGKIRLPKQELALKWKKAILLAEKPKGNISQKLCISRRFRRGY